MKINKIKLYNFSSYEGENIIDFSIIDNKKNIDVYKRQMPYVLKSIFAILRLTSFLR